jgi:hypothetical protein
VYFARAAPPHGEQRIEGLVGVDVTQGLLVGGAVEVLRKGLSQGLREVGWGVGSRWLAPALSTHAVHVAWHPVLLQGQRGKGDENGE